MRGKYKAVKTMVDGIVFDSKKEARVYLKLKAMEESGDISNLRRQVKYTLIPEQREEPIVTKKGLKPGKLIERKAEYIADFVYEKDGKEYVVDAKGMRTRDYILKRKLMLYMRDIRIIEE